MTWLLLIQTLMATQPQQTFDKANQLYAAGKYEEARAMYEDLLAQESVSPELYYNLGNSYFKLKRIGYAIFYYEKALKLDPADEDIKANLELAQLRRRDQMAIPPDFFLFTALEKTRDALSTKGWLWLTLAIWYAWAAVLIVRRVFWPEFPTLMIRCAGFLLVLSLTGLFFRRFDEEFRYDAVVLRTVVDARSEPSENASVVFVLHEGTKVEKRADRDEWIEIVLPDGKVGWIRQTNVGLL